MSQSLECSTEDLSGRLHATATAFTPNPAKGAPVQAIDDDEENSSLYGDSPSASTAQETPGEDVVEIPNNCTFCISLDRLLSCRKPFDQETCPHCIEMHHLFADKDKKHQDELTALCAKLAQLEKETPGEKFARLYADRNVGIEALKKAAEKMYKDAELVKVEIKEKEGALRMLEMEIKKVQPAAEFTIKEEKKGKRK